MLFLSDAHYWVVAVIGFGIGYLLVSRLLAWRVARHSSLTGSVQTVGFGDVERGGSALDVYGVERRYSQVLKIPAIATLAEITSGYRALMRRWGAIEQSRDSVAREQARRRKEEVTEAYEFFRKKYGAEKLPL